ncbi:hypothetical protein PENSPDRAFT_747704 [Peniophora sp. CONT]|nr:hypothetical protein PENSPDRAFT_747704 [Peniophora sp. CONT]
MATSEDALIFTVEGMEYTVEMQALARQSSAPLGLWLDNLIDATRHGITQPEVDAFLAAATGRNFYVVYTGNLTRLVDWYAILRLSTRWSFDALRNRAITCLEIWAPPSEKLFLARAYDVTQWLVPAFTALTLRTDPPSLTELRRCDPKDIALIKSARNDIDHQRLSNDESTVASHLARALGISTSVTPASRKPVMKALTGPGVPSLFSSSHDITTLDDFLFMTMRPEEAMDRVEPETVDELARAISNAPEFLSGTAEERRVYAVRAAHIALGALSRGARQPTFLEVGPRFVKSILQISKHTERIFAGALQSLDARFATFTHSPTELPRRDKYKIMPHKVTPSVYRTSMKNVQEFVATLLQQGSLRDNRWKRLRQSPFLSSQSHSLLEATLPLHKPLGEPAATHSQLERETDSNAYVIVADDPDAPIPSLHASRPSELDTTVGSIPNTVSARPGQIVCNDEPIIIAGNHIPSPVDYAVAAVLAGHYDAGVSHFTSDNTATIWSKLSERASFQPHQPEPAQGEHRIAPVSQLARAILRRAFRDQGFVLVPIGTDVLTRMTRGAPWLGRDLNSTFRALLNRWKEFENASGDYTLVKVDAGRYMSDKSPSSIGSQVYRERMERGRMFICAVAEKDAFVGCEVATRATARRAAELAQGRRIGYLTRS